jgi:hypothetical protein
MIATQETLPRLADLEQAIQLRIVERTCGRIQGLEVEASGDRVFIRGRAASFHLKQLAIQGIMEAMDSPTSPRLQVELQISVSPAKRDVS